MNWLPDKVKKLAQSVLEAGGRAMLVGGGVRDHLLKVQPKDFDIEVYGLELDQVRKILKKFGPINAVGESYQVFKVDQNIDVSLPRKDKKVGKGHRGFEVSGDPDLSFEEATRRRDFTINAMMIDLNSFELVDLHEGQKDLKNKIIRMVDPKTFGEDSLRVLRAAQFASRLGFSIEPSTLSHCQKIELTDLPSERLWGEIEKILLLSPAPSLGFKYLYELGAVSQLFPELAALVGVPQEPEWHPEGDVDVHTLMVIDEARLRIDDLDYPKKIVVMLAALCHDFGKPAVTGERNGRIRSIGHEEAGVPPTLSFLDRLGVYKIQGYDVRAQILAIVKQHLKPGQFFREKDSVGDGAFRRLARLVETDLLCRVAAADSLGRKPEGLAKDKWPNEDAQKWFRERIRELEIEEAAPPPLLMGRHLLALGLKPSVLFSEIIEDVYQAQLDGEIIKLEEAIGLAQKILNNHVH